MGGKNIDNDISYMYKVDENVAETFWGRKYEVNQQELCDYLVEWRKKAGISTKQTQNE